MHIYFKDDLILYQSNLLTRMRTTKPCKGSADASVAHLISEEIKYIYTSILC